MKFTLSTVALVATLLTQDALAGVVGFHPRHGYNHAAAKRSPSEAAAAREIVVREVVYVTETLTRVVTVAGNVKVAAPTPAPAPVPAPVVAHAKAAENDRNALLAGLDPVASAAWENWYRTKDQQPTTLQKVAAAPTPKAEAPRPAAPAPPAPAAPAVGEAPKPAKTEVKVTEQPKGTAPKIGKRGLAYNDANLVKQLMAGTAGGKAAWGYNWGSTPGDLPTGIEYVPMLWGVQSTHTGNWVQKANQAIASGSTHLLGFNEPDHWEQAKVDPGTCASAYKQHMQPFAGKAKLGAPAVTNGGGEMGLNYLQQFLNACNGCTIDFVPIHWYDAAGNFEYFKKHVEDAKAVAGDRPLWITEFGAHGSDAEQASFLGQALPWLESQDYVERYAYFWVDNVLVKNPTVAAAYFG